MKYTTRTLLELSSGEMGEVVVIAGGWGIHYHLATLGIRPGKIVRKITTQPMGGPLLLEVEGARVAIGRGMAGRIMVR